MGSLDSQPRSSCIVTILLLALTRPGTNSTFRMRAIKGETTLLSYDYAGGTLLKQCIKDAPSAVTNVGVADIFKVPKHSRLY